MPGNCLGRTADFSKLSFCWVSSKPFCWRAVKMVPVSLTWKTASNWNGGHCSEWISHITTRRCCVISSDINWPVLSYCSYWTLVRYALGDLEHEEWIDFYHLFVRGKKRKGYRNTETQVWKSSTAVVVIMKICNNYWNLYEDCDTESNKSQDIPLGKGKCQDQARD